jgi:hypothetical protein
VWRAVEALGLRGGGVDFPALLAATDALGVPGDLALDLLAEVQAGAAAGLAKLDAQDGAQDSQGRTET